MHNTIEGNYSVTPCKHCLEFKETLRMPVIETETVSGHYKNYTVRCHKCGVSCGRRGSKVDASKWWNRIG